MIDWLTLKVGAELLSPEVQAVFKKRQGSILKIDSAGAVEWETPARESIRSDSHQVTVVLGGELTVTGSPARCMERDNAFGSGDPVACAAAMLGWVARHVGVELPPLQVWRCTRMDITQSYDLFELSRVRVALSSLRHAEGGRYQVRTAAESVYWSTGSHVRSGKAYAKGPHLRYLVKKGKLEMPAEELALADRLLRLELSLRSQYWRERAEKSWWTYSEHDLDEIHGNYFAGLVGKVEVVDMENIREAIEKAAREEGRTEGQARSAFGFWCLIQSQGHSAAKEMTARPTYYRHMRLLRAAGLSWADFQARAVVPLRRTPLVLAQPVRSWDELRRAA